MAEIIILPNRALTSKNNNPYIETACKDCDLKQMRRRDAVTIWNGRCRKCASQMKIVPPDVMAQRVAKRLKTISEWSEEKKLARAKALRQQILRQGGIPNRKPFVKEGEDGRRMAGTNHYAWKGGPEFQVGEGRSSREYAQWRMTIFQRDNFTCQMCGIRGGKLHADHILPWSTHRELRFELSNGRTLCIPCHKTTPTYGWRNVK